MDEDIDQEAEEGKLDLLNPVETGTLPGAVEFSMAQAKRNYLGGGQEKTQKTDAVTGMVKGANLRLEREVFPKNPELRRAFDQYRKPHKNVSNDELRARLERYVSLAGQDLSYRAVLNKLRAELPEQFYVYRGGIGNSRARTLENYSVLPEVADVFAMGEQGYKEGASVVRELINKDQIVALGSGREAEIIVKTKLTQAKAA